VNILAQKAKERLLGVMQEVDARLAIYWEEEIGREFGYDDDQRALVKRMLSHAREHNLRAGKRLRASLVLAGYELGMESDESVWSVAMAVEIIHTALLIHDDFMDGDTLRRGKPTTHMEWAQGDTHYGETMAVNIGDGVLMLGFEMIARSDMDDDKKILVLKQILRGIANTAWGQAYDVSLSKVSDVKTGNVLALHRAKTSLYTYENPLLAGALMAGVDKEVIEVLKKYAEYGGVAFQIQDDILGVYGDPGMTGKSDDSDIRQSKVTTLLTEMVEVLSEAEKERLGQIWGKQDANESEIAEIKKMIRDSGAYDRSKQMAVDLARQAVGVVRDLRKMGCRSEAVDYLEGIALYMVEREV
jgi:geranylgeranyl diphosphate synthase, type I